MRCFSLALVAALAAVASASLLPVSVRVVEPADAIGVFTGGGFPGQGCPFRIEHTETVSEGGNTIPHSAMIHNKRLDCDDEGEMTVYLDPEAASDAVSNPQSKAFIESFASLDEPAIYGIEKNGRKCGGSVFGPETVVILFTPDEIKALGSDVFPPERRYMIIDDPDPQKPGICAYSADARKPDPTPEPSLLPDPGTSIPRDPKGTPGVEEPVGPPGGRPGGRPGRRPKPQGVDEEEPIPSVSIEMEEEISPEPSEDDGSICFPADASVETEDGTIKKISDVQIGDRVKVADGMYSDVFMFTHKDSSTVHDFVTLSTASGDQISATRGHYLYINGRFAVAASAKVGDNLELSNGARTTINNVSIEKKVGLFNPQTVHGDIIVNSIRASTFTRTIEPPTAQALLAPLRMMYDFVGLSVSFLNNGADSVAAMLPVGRASL